MNKKILLVLTLVSSSLFTLVGCNNGAEDKYEGDKLILKIKNLYFGSWDGSDGYTKIIEDKFGVKIKPGSYDKNNWSSEVTTAVNAAIDLPDVFHYDVESFNFGNSYKFWSEGEIIKALPDDLSNWPEIKRLIDNTSNIDALKLNGKLYGIPLSYNIDEPNKPFSQFTYVYRRDWVKAIDERHKIKTGEHAGEFEDGYVPLFQENDEYTFEQFKKILEAFKSESKYVNDGKNADSIGDVGWGFPSLTNFYKDSPHCYTYDKNGKVINAFTTDEYIEGLKLTRKYLKSDDLYFDQVSYEEDESAAHNAYKIDMLGVYYDNFSYTNYYNLRKDFKETHSTATTEQIDDACAFMKVRGEDGRFHLEGSENWFSMTMFNYDISEFKFHKILDIINYVLTEEGTKLAIYGKENYDYFDNDGDIELNEDNWIKVDGEYAPKPNGAKYLRSLATLSNDTTSYDPHTDQNAYQIVNEWKNRMLEAYLNNELAIFEEPSEIKWLSSNLKDMNTSILIDEGNTFAMRYCDNKEGYREDAEYIAKFNTARWNNTLAEINAKLGK